MRPFRNSIPNRTCTKKYSTHSSYKRFLREDFRKRCGYCDDLDIPCGGSNGFHVDHFRPKSLFRRLQNNYNNLVYACPYCNIAKSDDWPSSDKTLAVLNGKGYIDPCDVDFDNHFERHDDGRIRSKTDVGNYMYKQLRLGLRRHQLLWMCEQLETTIKKVQEEFDKGGDDDTLLTKNYMRLTTEYFKYKGLFEETL